MEVKYAGYTVEALRAMDEGAKAGPWEARNIPYRLNDGSQVDMWDVYHCPHSDGLWYSVSDGYDETTTRFVAAARAVLPALLDEVARLRGALEALANEHEQFLITEYNHAESDTLRAARAALEVNDGH